MQPFDFGWRWIHSRDGNEWQLEAQRDYGGWTLGAALDMGPHDNPDAALAGFFGNGWQWNKLRLEATAGIGLELVQRPSVQRVTIESSVSGTSSTSTLTSALRTALYGRTNASLVWQLRPSVALMLRLALHLENEDIVYCYGAALLGLRINLP
jgi:hypothetical protein